PTRWIRSTPPSWPAASPPSPSWPTPSPTCRTGWASEPMERRRHLGFAHHGDTESTEKGTRRRTPVGAPLVGALPRTLLAPGRPTWPGWAPTRGAPTGYLRVLLRDLR